MKVSQRIIEVFENYLEEKGIEIENEERTDDECNALIYGTEYGNLQDEIENILKEENIYIQAKTYRFYGKIIDIHYNTIEVKSDSLEEYLEYSIE